MLRSESRDRNPISCFNCNLISSKETNLQSLSFSIPNLSVSLFSFYNKNCECFFIFNFLVSVADSASIILVFNPNTFHLEYWMTVDLIIDYIYLIIYRYYTDILQLEWGIWLYENMTVRVKIKKTVPRKIWETLKIKFFFLLNYNFKKKIINEN